MDLHQLVFAGAILLAVTAVHVAVFKRIGLGSVLGVGTAQVLVTAVALVGFLYLIQPHAWQVDLDSSLMMGGRVLPDLGVPREDVGRLIDETERKKYASLRPTKRLEHGGSQ